MKKSKKSKEAKFFCESCGSEVPRKSKFCPRCGKFFASVRCPHCGKLGTNEDFKSGCPQCGYAVHPIFKGLTNNTVAQTKSYDAALPIWIYIVTTMVLMVLVFCLYSCL